MALPPHRLDDLFALAKALTARPGPGGAPTKPRRFPRGAVYLMVAVVTATMTFAWRAVAPCGFRPSPTAVSDMPPLRDTVAVALAPQGETDPSDDPAEAPAMEPTSDQVERLDTTRIDGILAAQRATPIAEVGVPPRAPTPRRAPVGKPTVVRAPVAAATIVLRPTATPLPEPTSNAAFEGDAPPIVVEPPPPRPRGDGWVARADRDRYDPHDDVEPADETDSEPDVSGRWLLTNAIAATSYGPYAGMRIRFRVRLEQHGDRIVGRGEKFTVDDRPVPPGQRTPIEIEGTIEGREVSVRFVERGTRRTSSGGFRWRVSPDGKRLQGTFRSTAAGTEGPSHASRER